ncbi:tRNA dihydrouridine synthase A [gamma proteobacterium IMCC2047]|nr:tRNA dihydrouridine synthase A [gamma proteobacterium IMCC2047]
MYNRKSFSSPSHIPVPNKQNISSASPAHVKRAPNRRLCIAPMLDWSDRHYRYFMRLISQHALLYSEMVTTGAIIHGDRDHLLGFDNHEQPVALQLGGSSPSDLAECSKIGEDRGYNEINLNVGCPSDRVQNGAFGACLMAKPELVAACLESMQRAVNIPVTVKHRIGIDDLDSYELLQRFIEIVSHSGCSTFIIHARKAFLQGLSPKENRDIPPLKYDWVYQIKEQFPHLEIIINGGIKSLTESQKHLEQVDGVMIGREAYHNPYSLAQADAQLFDDHHQIASRHDILQQFLPYIEQQLTQDVRLTHISKHILGLFHGQPGGRKFRQYISENAYKPGAGIEVLENAAKLAN